MNTPIKIEERSSSIERVSGIEQALRGWAYAARLSRRREFTGNKPATPPPPPPIQQLQTAGPAEGAAGAFDSKTFGRFEDHGLSAAAQEQATGETDRSEAEAVAGPDLVGDLLGITVRVAASEPEAASGESPPSLPGTSAPADRFDSSTSRKDGLSGSETVPFFTPADRFEDHGLSARMAGADGPVPRSRSPSWPGSFSRPTTPATPAAIMQGVFPSRRVWHMELGPSPSRGTVFFSLYWVKLFGQIDLILAFKTFTLF